MKRAVLKTKDGTIFYGDPYEGNCDCCDFVQDLGEMVRAINKNGLRVLDVVDHKVENIKESED